MRFKPGPLTEASAVSAIGWFTCLLLFSVLYADLGKGVNQAVNLAIMGYMPAFSLWGIGGYLSRAKPNRFRFLLNMGISLFVALAGSALLLTAVHSAVGLSASELSLAVAQVVLIEGAFLLTALLGAAFTYLWFLDKDPKK